MLAQDLYRIESAEARQALVDLSDVGTDLSEVPLDEVLAFRRQYASYYREYIIGLRQFLETQLSLDRAQRDRARLDRQQIIRDQAADLRRISRMAFGVKASTLLVSLAGAGWTLKRGDPFGALLAALLAGTTAVPVPGRNVTSYTYVLQTRRLR